MPIAFPSGAGALVSTTTDFWSGATGLALCGWFRVRATAGAGSFIAPWMGQFYRGHALQFLADATGFAVKWQLTRADGAAILQSGSLQLDIWYHLALLHDATSGTRLYINADAAGSDPTATALPVQTAPFLHAVNPETGTAMSSGWALDAAELAAWVGTLPDLTDLANLRDRLVTADAVQPASLAYSISGAGTAGAAVQAGDPGLTNAGTATGQGDISTVGSPAPTYAADDPVFVWPAVVARARVAPSGQALVIEFRDRAGTAASVLAITSHPTVTIDGGSPVALTAPVWADTAEERLSYAVYPLPVTVATGAIVTLDAPAEWATTAAGSVGALEAYPAEDHVGGSLFPSPFAATARQLQIGYNLASVNYFNPGRLLADLTAGAPAFDPFFPPTGGLSAQRLPLDGAAAGARYLLSPAVPNGHDTQGLAIAPAGSYPVRWTGGGKVTLQGLTPSADDWDGSAKVNTRFYPVSLAPGKYAPELLLEFDTTTGPVSDVHVYLPGTDPANPPEFDPPYLSQLTGARSLRFMQANLVASDFANATESAEFLRDGYRLGLATEVTRHVRATYDQVDAYANPNDYFDPTGQVLLLLRTTTPHGLQSGQVITFADAPSVPITLTAGDPIGQIFGGLIEVVDSTHFGLAMYHAGGGTVTGPQATTGTLEMTAQPGLPIEVIVRLCNAASAGLWLVLPPLVSDAACQAIAAFIAANLNAGLSCRVEWCNEAWNSANPYIYGYQYCQARGMALGLAADRGTAGIRYFALRTAEVHEWFRQAFTAAGRAADFLATWATHTFNTTRTELIAAYCADPAAFAAQPSNWTAGPVPIEELAVAPYLDNGPVGSANATVWDALSVDQLLDLMELYVQHSPFTGGLFQTHLDALTTAGYPNVKLVAYEGSPQLGCPVNRESQSAIDRAQAWYRHPRFREIMLQYLQRLEDKGLSLLAYYLLNNQIEGLPLSARNTAWAAYYGRDMEPGRGDGSDGKFDNRTDPYALDQVVSVVGDALQTYAALANPDPAAGTRALFLTTAGGVAVPLCY